jgi:membrane peptidoglycan carboxypeptidase
MKPLTYLTALQSGLQPNTLVSDDPITLAPIGAQTGIIAREYNSALREEYYWSPRNADGSMGGMFTMRRGLENSVNVVTAHLLEGGISADPEKSLDQVCATAVAAKIYAECVRYYPFVLGAQPVRMIDLAAFYAAVANEGALPKPHAIESIESDGHTVFQYPSTPLPFISAADRTSFYQLKTMLQGVVARGTARAIGGLSPYVAGKTGTTEDAVDGWFIGFTNDVTIAVWVGYDNGDGKRRSLGTTATGARVALPIFEPILQAIWAQGIAPKAPLSGPSPEAKRYLVDLPIDYYSGTRIGGSHNGGQYGQYQYSENSGQGFTEHLRIGPDGKLYETQYQLMATRQEGDPARNPEGEAEQSWGAWGWGGGGRRAGTSPYYPGAQQDYYQQQQQGNYQQQQRPVARGFFAPWNSREDRRGSWSGWPF